MDDGRRQSSPAALEIPKSKSQPGLYASRFAPRSSSPNGNGLPSPPPSPGGTPPRSNLVRIDLVHCVNCGFTVVVQTGTVEPVRCEEESCNGQVYQKDIPVYIERRSLDDVQFSTRKVKKVDYGGKDGRNDEEVASSGARCDEDRMDVEDEVR